MRIYHPTNFANSYSEKRDAPANSSTRYSISIGDSFSGYLGEYDVDWIAIDLRADDEIEISLEGSGSSPVADTVLTIYDAAGNIVASDDDGGIGFYSQLDFTASVSGTYYIEANTYDNRYRGTGSDTGHYTLAVSKILPLPVYTNDKIAKYLTDDFWVAFGEQRAAFDVSPGETITYNMTGLTDAGKVLAEQAFEAWTMVSGIKFRAVSNGGQIILDDNEAGAYAIPMVSDSDASIITSAEINISTAWLDYFGTDLNSYSFQTYMHEIGHTLGLGHAGAYNGSAIYGRTDRADNSYINDSWQATIMSYFSQIENTFIDADFAYTVTPMVADILAIQDLYGVAGNIRTGNTIYGAGSTAGGYYDRMIDGKEQVAFTIIDDGGVDTLNFTSSYDQVIRLNDESISDVFGLTGNMIIARDTVIENAFGGSGVDQIYGNDANNVIMGRSGSDDLFGQVGNDKQYGNHGNDRLYGGNGNDLLDGGNGADILSGGNGSDWASYHSSGRAITANLDNSNANTGAAYGDVYRSIENLYGSRYNDYLYGDNGGNRLSGGHGNDVLIGGGGADVLNGGGGGNDWSSYATASGTVLAHLAIADLNTGDARGDVYRSVENLYGSSYNDYLYGDNGNNRLAGGHGDDRLGGGGKNDQLYGGHGNDRLNGDNGADILYGGVGNDFCVGGRGDDLLNGGRGADVFWFAVGDGADVIEDFEIGVDRIRIAKVSSDDITLKDTSDGVSLKYGDGDSILVSDLKSSDITFDDFIFA